MRQLSTAAAAGATIADAANRSMPGCDVPRRSQRQDVLTARPSPDRLMRTATRPTVRQGSDGGLTCAGFTDQAEDAAEAGRS